MLEFLEQGLFLVGLHGSIVLPDDDEITRKFCMLYEGECEGLGAAAAAEKFGYSTQRYYQLLAAFREKGAMALKSQKRGPKSNYRRTDEVVRRVIRYRFLDPDASPEVIAQRIRQAEMQISDRSVARVIQEYGIQKKTLQDRSEP